MEKTTVHQFIEETASKSPVPGGGGASALAGALGMALGSMVGNLTLGKKKYAEQEPEIREILKKAQGVQNRFMELIEEDARVFAPLAAAYGLPKDTPEQAERKEAVLQEALVGATLIPLEIARCTVQALELHKRLAEIGTRIAISDVGVGVALCQAAVRGARLNVLINTRMIKDTKFRESVETEIDAIEAQIITDGNRIYDSVVQAVR